MDSSSSWLWAIHTFFTAHSAPVSAYSSPAAHMFSSAALQQASTPSSGFTGIEWLQLFGIIIALIFSALSSATETAMTSVSRIKIKNLVAEGVGAMAAAILTGNGAIGQLANLEYATNFPIGDPDDDSKFPGLSPWTPAMLQLLQDMEAGIRAGLGN